MSALELVDLAVIAYIAWFISSILNDIREQYNELSVTLFRILKKIEELEARVTQPLAEPEFTCRL